ESIKSQPHHLFELAIRLFSISLSQANCEKNFLTLKWFVDELTYFGTELTKSELCEMVKLATIDDHIVDKVNENNNTYEGDLKDFVNLRDPVFQERDNIPFEFSFNTSETSVEEMSI
ncbi:31458_t:CDS:2, partial [Gigaspora margarita]